MISSVLRNLVVFAWWLVLTAVAIMATAWAVIEHYLNAANGLELAGTETKPLSADSLIGPFISAFIPDATLSQAMALTISLVEALAFFMITNRLRAVLELTRIRRASRQAGEDEEVREATWRLLETTLVLSVLGGVVIWGILWDIDIFRFRSMAGAYGLDDPAKAASTLPSWAQALQEDGGMAAIQLARFGAWGYLSFTASAVLALDLCFEKLDDQFSRFMKPFDKKWDAWQAGRTEEAQTEVFYGYDQAGQPVYDSKATIAYDTKGQPVGEEQAATETTREASITTHEKTGTPSSPEVHPEESSPPAMATIHAYAAAAPAAPNGAGSNGAASRPLFDPVEVARPLSQPVRLVAAPRGPDIADLREVLGGEPGERISLAEGTAHRERYYVSLATGQVWKREAWERLHSVGSEMEREGR